MFGPSLSKGCFKAGCLILYNRVFYMLLFIPRLISNGLVSSLTPHPLTAQTLVSPLNSGTPIVTTPSFEVLGFCSLA